MRTLITYNFLMTVWDPEESTGFEVREIQCCVTHIHYLYKLKKIISSLPSP